VHQRLITAPELERQTYTVDEAAKLLGISRSTAYECIRDGLIPALHFRKRIVVTRATIDAILAESGSGDAVPAPSL
jgi:excisionase family DNA binding protein